MKLIKRLKTINRSDLTTYYNVGKMLSEAGKHYGEGIIKEYSKRLTAELGKGYSNRNLRNIKQFFIVKQKWQTLSAKLTWSHYCEILWFDKRKFFFYVSLAEANNLSVRELRNRIKTKEYERLPEDARNKIISNNESNIIDYVKNPIIIKNNNYNDISEKVLQKIILEDIPSFLNELGTGFSFIGNEYKIRIGNNYNYIDLLLFNYEYNCFVVVELKVTELKKEHLGQIRVYMNYIDDNLRKDDQDKTMGILICRKDNKFVINLFKDERIITREYKLV